MKYAGMMGMIIHFDGHDMMDDVMYNVGFTLRCGIHWGKFLLHVFIHFFFFMQCRMLCYEYGLDINEEGNA